MQHMPFERDMDVESLLRFMVRKHASDLFVTAGVSPSIKVNGKLEFVSKTGLSAEQARKMVFSVMNSQQRDEFDSTQECNFAIHLPEIGRFRVNVFQQQNNVGMVVRRIQTKIPTIDELGLPPTLKVLSMSRRGLIVYVGATGAGKSTSLAAMVGYRNCNSSGHIVTIEEPIEYIHSHAGCIVTQREVGLDTQNFDAALKNALRQAPDVIMIGEVRSREIMEKAIAFAETGHLCLITLHANDAAQAMDRILNFFPEDRHNQLLMDLSMNLKAVIGQRLIPRPNGTGRRAAIEILINTPRASDLIRNGDIYQLKELMGKSTAQGMKTFDQAIYELYCAGEISYEDAIKHADSENEVRLMIKLGQKSDIDSMASSLGDVALEEYEEEY